MGRSIIHSNDSIKLERNRQCLTDLQIDTVVELEEVWFPISVYVHTVRPSYLRVITHLLAVVDVIIRDGIIQSLLGTEHQDSCKGKAFFATVRVLAVCSDFLEKRKVVQFRPRMLLILSIEQSPVLRNRILVNLLTKNETRKHIIV